MLETVIKEDDERVEAWYLLAFSNFNLKKWVSAQDCCMQVKSCMVKQKIRDTELEEGTREIYNEVQK